MQPDGIVFVEPVSNGAVEIQNADDSFVNNQGQHDFGLGSGITSDVSRKMMHVGNDDRLPSRRCRATDAST